jgi:hypothetical protein
MERLIAAQSRAPQVEPVVTRPPAVIQRRWYCAGAKSGKERVRVEGGLGRKEMFTIRSEGFGYLIVVLLYSRLAGMG